MHSHHVLSNHRSNDHLESSVFTMKFLNTTGCIALFSLLWWEASSFSSCQLTNLARHHDAGFPPLAATAIENDELVESSGDESSQKELVLGFVDMVLHETPRGAMKADEVDLLREVMNDFPMDVEEVEPASVVESLLHRLLNEWEEALRNEDDEKEALFRPNEKDFFAAISAWEKSQDPDNSVVHVLSLLSDQRELFMSDVEDAKPSLRTIKSVLKILAASGERGLDRRASVVFNSLQDYQLVADPEVYELLVGITARGRSKGAPERAEKLLREGVERYPPQMQNGVISGIGTDAFNKVITSYAKRGEENDPKRAEELIVWMDQVDTDNGSLGVCSPTINSFTSLIDAYAQQNEWEAASQADRILNQLIEQFMEGKSKQTRKADAYVDPRPPHYFLFLLHS